jgi:hypothetical protein
MPGFGQRPGCRQSLFGIPATPLIRKRSLAKRAPTKPPSLLHGVETKSTPEEKLTAARNVFDFQLNAVQ